MKGLSTLVLALLIIACSVAGMIYAWAGSSVTLDFIAAVQTCCFLGFAIAAKLISIAGNTANALGSQDS